MVPNYAMQLMPRVIRFKDAPGYLSMDRNRFNKEVRPSLVEIPIGTQGIGFDRLDLDAWFEAYKERNGRPRTTSGDQSWAVKSRQDSASTAISGTSSKPSKEFDFFESTGESDLEKAEQYLAKRIEEIRQEKAYGVQKKRTFSEAAARYLLDHQHKRSLGRDAESLKILVLRQPSSVGTNVRKFRSWKPNVNREETPMAKFYRVTLTGEERDALEGLLNKGKGAARKLAHARISLQTDEAEGGPGRTDQEVAAALNVSARTVERVRQRFVEEELEAALVPKPSSRVYTRLLDGAQEAHLIALACSEPPEGKPRWTLRLLADRLVELESVESISHETVRSVLKKTNLSRIFAKCG
jgi:transposase